jgi:hypothetical protein
MLSSWLIFLDHSPVLNTFPSDCQSSGICHIFPDFSCRRSYHLATVPPERFIEIPDFRRIRLGHAPKAPLVAIGDISG